MDIASPLGRRQTVAALLTLTAAAIPHRAQRAPGAVPRVVPSAAGAAAPGMSVTPGAAAADRITAPRVSARG